MKLNPICQTVLTKIRNLYSTFAVDFLRTPCTLRKASPLKDEDKDFVLNAVGAPKTDE